LSFTSVAERKKILKHVRAYGSYNIRVYNDRNVPTGKSVNHNAKFDGFDGAVHTGKGYSEIGMGLAMNTTTDDNNHMERVMCRNELFSMTKWNLIKKANSYSRVARCKLDQTLCVNLKDIVSADTLHATQPNPTDDKSMVETWDLETYSKSGDFPDAANKSDCIFAVGNSYHWLNESDSILNVCIITRPCAPRPNFLTIVCKSERALIRASINVHSRMKPEFFTGFNDGDFDWPYMIKRAVLHNELLNLRDTRSLYTNPWADNRELSVRKENIFKWDCRPIKIKIEAPSTFAYFRGLRTVGVICLDTRICLRKKYPKEPKSSLKYFAEFLHLDMRKEDMPIHTMFAIYKKSVLLDLEVMTKKSKGEDIPQTLTDQVTDTMLEMSDVASYCMTDARLCQQMLVSTNIINAYRGISGISNTTMFDAIYYADGMKVRNVIIGTGQKRGLLFHTNMDPTKVLPEGVKYPGGFVFNPIKGLVRPKLTIRERVINDSRWVNVSSENLKQMDPCSELCYDLLQ
jgi:DNA polymerase elongation subunit (family B)